MKRSYQYIAVILTSSFIAASCIRDIEFRGSEADPKIVVYSLLQPDSVITVSVARSHTVFDERYVPEQITDAVVRLYQDNVLLGTLTYVAPEPQPGYYQVTPYSKYVSDEIKPVYGSTYRIEVEEEGLAPVSAETKLPAQVPVIRIDTMETVQQEGNVVLITKIKFCDPAGTDNLYRLKVWSKTGVYFGDKTVPYDPMQPVFVNNMDCSYATSDEPLITPQQEDDVFGMFLQNSYNLFTDELISGKEYDLTLKINQVSHNADYFEFSHIYIELQSLTEGLYLYLRSYAAHRQTRENFLAEPVLVYTNIYNGLGVFGALSASFDTIRIGEYPVEGVRYEVR